MLLNDETLQGLYAKHPSRKDIKPFSLLYGPTDDVPSTYFEFIDEELIQKVAMATHGAARPSKLDAKTEGLVLRNEIAMLANKLATENLDSIALESYNANHLRNGPLIIYLSEGGGYLFLKKIVCKL